MSLKPITSRKLSGPGCYGEACAAAHALELVGERWALLVMRELMLGARRFTDLRASLPMLSANVLTQRLRTLEAAGVVRRIKMPPPAASQVYEMTRWGYESEPVFLALGRWGVLSPFLNPALPITPTALMLSLRAMFAPGQAKGLHVRAVIVIGAERYAAVVAHGKIKVSRGEGSKADLVLEGSSEAIARALYENAALSDHEQTGIAIVTGDRIAAKRFLTLFPLPTRTEFRGNNA